jgi:hypothetical protein
VVPQEVETPAAVVEAVAEEKPSETDSVGDDEPEIGTRKF